MRWADLAFDPSRSVLSRDPERLKALVSELEKVLGHAAKIVGILEIGSFIKDEGVLSSDSDLRVYVDSPEAYFWQSFGTGQKAKLRPEKEKYFESFLEASPSLPRVTFEWDAFNNPVAHELSVLLEANLEFGIADARFTRHQFDNLGNVPMGEYELLFQGRIIHDLQGFLSQLYDEHFGRRHETLCAYYQQNYLDRLLPQVALHTQPNEYDQHKVEKSGQIMWVKWAVRAIRDAVASKTYQTSGKFVYRKQDILDFYQKYLPQHMGLINQLYSWKTDQVVRAEMVQKFVADPAPLFDEFRILTPKLERIVSDVNKLEL